MNHFNKLTPAQDERLALIFEEAAEVIQAIAKIQRHGYQSGHPDGGPTNRQMLEQEIGDLQQVISIAINAGDLSTLGIACGYNSKALRIGNYLHHQS